MKREHTQPLLRIAFKALLRVPISRRSALALGALAYYLSARYRDVADKNLKIAFGDSLTEKQRQALIKRVFQSFALSMSEFLSAPRLTPDQIRARVQADSFASVDTLLARGKGMIVVTAHFGNWELLARRAALEGYRFTVVARQSEDESFNAITDRLRENGGYTVHPRGASPRPILQHMRQGGVLAILPDQKSEDIFVPFFGRLAGTVAGPAVLALRTGAPILPIFCPRRSDGTYRVVIKPEIDTTPTGDSEADTLRIMTEINHVIESMIREYPEQWLWLHDRWRVAPPEEASSRIATPLPAEQRGQA
jgi:KDO2-lipid IV(A) lauroyltransferase